MRKFLFITLFLALTSCSSDQEEAPVPQDDTDQGPVVAKELKPLKVLMNADRPLIGISQDNPASFSVSTSSIESFVDESHGLNALIIPAFDGSEPGAVFTNPDPEGTLNPEVVLGTEEFAIDLAISADLPSGAKASCFGLNSWIGVITEEICAGALNSHVITFTSDKIQKEELRISVYSTNGEPDDFLVSTSIDSHRIRYKQISDMNPSGSDAITKIFEFRGSLYFVSSFTGFERMYKFESGLFKQVTSIGSSGDQIEGITKNDTTLYFQATNSFGTKIYSYSGITGSNLQLISNLNFFGSDFLFPQMDYSGERLYFVSDHNSASEDRLMFHYGTGIDAVSRDLYPPGVDEITYLKVAGSNVYFQALDNDGLKKLWRYDPNFDGGTGRVEKMAGLYDGFDDEIKSLRELNGFVYFVARNSVGREKLFKLDPSTKSSKQLSATNVAGSDNITEFEILGGKIYLSAKNNLGQQKPYMYDPSQGLFFQITNFYSGDEFPKDFTLYGGFVYFSAQINSSGHRKLFLFDKDSNTVVQVSDINQNDTDNIGNIELVNSVLYFTADVDGEQKMFRLCDESQGCIN